jgi:hypothetical protein
METLLSAALVLSLTVGVVYLIERINKLGYQKRRRREITREKAVLFNKFARSLREGDVPGVREAIKQGVGALHIDDFITDPGLSESLRNNLRAYAIDDLTDEGVVALYNKVIAATRSRKVSSVSSESSEPSEGRVDRGSAAAVEMQSESGSATMTLQAPSPESGSGVLEALHLADKPFKSVE